MLSLFLYTAKAKAAAASRYAVIAPALSILNSAISNVMFTSVATDTSGVRDGRMSARAYSANAKEVLHRNTQRLNCLEEKFDSLYPKRGLFKKRDRTKRTRITLE